MKQKILFRADASQSIGYGHFVRTLALADILKDDFDCIFYTQVPTDYQRTEVSKVCKLVDIPSDDSKFDLFLNLLKGDEIVFLDNYFFTPEYEKAIKDKGCKLVVLSPSIPHHYADIVINYVDKDYSHYSIEPYTKIVAGLEWYIIREPFTRPVIDNNRKKGHVIISFGGTDQYCLTEKVVDVLDAYQYHISAIFTSRVPEERRTLLKKRGISVYTDISSEEVAALFEQSEYAVLSSSTVCMEALSRGTKVLAGYYVDNQVNIYNVLLEEHCIKGLGYLLTPDSFANLIELMNSKTDVQLMPIDFTKQKDKYISLFKSLC